MPSSHRLSESTGGDMRKAAGLLDAGKAAAALTITRQLCASGTPSSELLELHARAARDAGDTDAAVAAIEKVIQSAGGTVNRALFYGQLLLVKERWQAAADIFQQVIKQAEATPQAWLGLGHCLLATRDFARALHCYDRVLVLEPENVRALVKFAVALTELGEPLRAAPMVKRALELDPGSDEAAVIYGEALLQSGHVEEVLPLLAGRRFAPHWQIPMKKLLIRSYMSTERFDKAGPLLEELLSKEPDDPSLLLSRARLLATQGRSEEALSVLESVADRDPDNDTLWEPYIKQLDGPLPEGLLARLQAHMEKARAAGRKRALASMHFAAYQHYGRVGEIEREMAELEAGNRLMAEVESHDQSEHVDNVLEEIHCYTSDRVSELANQSSAFRPVFIMCPPRSGSTLLEQALARHSAFWAGGEKGFAADAWQALTGNSSITRNPEFHRELTPERVKEFAQYCMESLRDRGMPEGVRMVHKGINNYKFAGLLKAAFPEARFIELRRDPVDVAFGCYRQNFTSQAFSFTLEGCASEIALYQRSMDWWRVQMPEAIRRVNYEDLVADFEGEVTALLEWLGEDWEENCRDFSRTGNVATASIHQVRKGLFKEGVGRARRYEAWLGPLFDAFEQYGVDWSDSRKSEPS